jgi:hypothetical protein
LVVVSDWFPSTNYMVIGVVGAIRKFWMLLRNIWFLTVWQSFAKTVPSLFDKFVVKLITNAWNCQN